MNKFYLLLLTFIAFDLQAQNSISGKVIDPSGQAIPGANVYIQNTYEGTSSLVDGSFSFTTEETGPQILIVSFIGYVEQQQVIELPATESLIVTLEEQFSRMEGVTITAGAFEASDEKKGVLLRPLDIATTAGATADISGALNTLPGTTKVGETGRLFVRGGEGHETQTFIDGLWVQNAYNATVDNLPSRNRFSPFMFKGTLFSTGGYSAEYSQALSSTLVLNTIDYLTANQTDFSIMTVGGSIAHTAVGDKHAITGELGYINLQPYFSLIKQNDQWEKAPQSLNGSLVYRYKIKKTGLLKVYVSASHGSLDLFRKDSQTLTKKLPLKVENLYAYVNVSYRNLLSDKWSVFAGMSYNFSKDDLVADREKIAAQERGIHLKNTWTYDWNERLAIRMGYESFIKKSQFDVVSQEEFNTKIIDDVLTGAFTEADIYLSKKITARAGLRVDYSSLQGEVAPAPRLSVAYKTGEKSQVSFAYGQFAQQPQSDWLFEKSDLDFESSDHYILNYQWSSNDRTLRGELYQKEYNNLVKYEGDFINGISSLNNAGNGYARGFDLFWRDRKSIKNADYWFSYSFLDTKRQYLNYPKEAVPSFASAHNISLVYKHFVSSLKTQFGATVSYTSPRPFHNPNKKGFNDERTQSFTDLSINAAFLYRQNIIFYASATNLLGTENIYGYRYAKEPNSNGNFNSEAIQQGAPRFLFLGIFITLAKDKTKNQLDNL